MCGCKDWGQGHGNMEKSSFAFRRNAIRRLEFHVIFYYLIYSMFDLIVSFGWELSLT